MWLRLFLYTIHRNNKLLLIDIYILIIVYSPGNNRWEKIHITTATQVEAMTAVYILYYVYIVITTEKYSSKNRSNK